MPHFYDCINTIHQFINLFLDTKMSISEEYVAFSKHVEIMTIFIYPECELNCFMNTDIWFITDK